jgi:transcriptional regulator with XRE-family HTH domain
MGTYGHDIQSATAVQIKVELTERGWKQPDLAEHSGIPRTTLHRYLNGERDIPLPAFADIAGALGMSYVELAGRAQRRLDGENVQ